MKKKRLIIPAVFCLPFLGGCTSTQSPNSQLVEPLFRVTGTADHPESLYQLGRYYQGQSRYEQAIAAYKRALQADSHFSKARNGLGVVLSMQGRYDEAIQAFELAIREAPDDAYIYSNLGYAYYLKGLDAQAIDALKRAISHDPGNVRAHNNLELAYARAGGKPDPVNMRAGVAGGQGLGTQSDRVPEGSRNGAASPMATPASQEMLPSQPAPAVSVDLIAKTIPVTRSSIEVVQNGMNIYELKERTEAVPVAAQPHTDDAALASPANLAARIEISNGNGVNGMAKAVGGFLRGQGFNAARLTNKKSFAYNVTQIEYRSGFMAEAARLRASLPKEVYLVEAKDLRKDISVRLVLGKDIARSASLFDASTRKMRLARS